MFLPVLGTLLFGLAGVSALVIAGFGLAEGDYRTAGFMGVMAGLLLFAARACRQDWIREKQRRESA